jgi:hypothetical protein
VLKYKVHNQVTDSQPPGVIWRPGRAIFLINKLSFLYNMPPGTGNRTSAETREFGKLQAVYINTHWGEKLGEPSQLGFLPSVHL